MKYYIDSSIIIALINEKDPNHEKAIANYPKDGEKVISKLVVLNFILSFHEPLNSQKKSLMPS